MKKNINFKKHTLRVEASQRGGGIEISLSFLGKKYNGQKMTAYQNYLGGGILGSIKNDCTMRGWQQDSKLTDISEKLNIYFHSLTNPDTEFESATYEALQRRPASAY